ncbi:Carbonic anhydrase 2 (Beta-CA 2) (Carbonate dehydratase 2) (mtCA 2), partial [Durusdinium trenchii]
MSRLLVAAVFVCPAWAGKDSTMSLSAATAAAGITLLVGVGTLVAANVLLKKKASAKSQAEPVKEEACYSLKTKSSADLQAEPVKEACKPVRTAADAPMPPDEALKLLKEGNARFIKGEPQATRTNKAMRKQLVDMGQAPHTAIIGCADSRAPLETIFDTMPGDIFVLRNAGNTCTHAEGSMVGS